MTGLELAKQKPIQLILGIVFTALPLSFVAILLFISSLLNSQVPALDVEQLNANGKMTLAVVTGLEQNENITINGRHPTVLTYQYLDGDQQVENKFRTLNTEADRLKIGDKLKIKYLDGRSTIVGLEPFAFPYVIIAIVLSPFLIFGLANLGYLFYNVNDMIQLYRYGEVWDATIILITPRSGLPLSGIGAGVDIHYQYKTSTGQPALGESITNDFSILSSKKPGDTIRIFVSPRDEMKSCLVPRNLLIADY
jgi:hypothetical protein